jgi:hypothetical protein
MSIDIGAITATLSMTDDFSAVLSRVQSALAEVGVKTKQTGDDIDASTQKIQAAYNRLASSLDPAVSGALKYQSAHVTLTSALEKGIITHETYSESLTKAGEKFLSAGSNASTFHDLVNGVTQIASQCGQATADLGTKLDGLVGRFSSLVEGASALGPLAPIVLGLAAAVGLVMVAFEGAKFLADIVSEGMKTQVVVAQLDQTLKATGASAGYSSVQLIQHAEALTLVSGRSAETIISAEGILARFDKIGHDAFPRATQVALDYAQATGKDVPEAATLIGKALEGSTTGFKALTAAGIVLQAAQKKTLMDMIASGDIAGYQALMFALLEEKTKGAALAYQQTLAGGIATAQAQFGIFKNTVASEVIPALEDMLNSLVKQLGGWQNIQDFAKFAAHVIGDEVRTMVYGVVAGYHEWAAEQDILIIRVNTSLKSFVDTVANVVVGVLDFFSRVPVALGGLGEAGEKAALMVRESQESIDRSLQEQTDSAQKAAAGHIKALDDIGKKLSEHRLALEGTTKVYQNNGSAVDDIAAKQKAHADILASATKTIDAYNLKIKEQVDHYQFLLTSQGALYASLGQGLIAYDQQKLAQERATAVETEIVKVTKEHEAEILKLEEAYKKLTSGKNADAAAAAQVKADIKASNDLFEVQRKVLGDLAGQAVDNKRIIDGRVASEKDEITISNQLRTETALLADAQTRSSVASYQVAIAIAAETKARAEIAAGSKVNYDDRVRELTQQAQYLQGLKDQALIQNQINSATDAMAKLRAQVSDMNELNTVTQQYGSTISGILSKYGLLSDATRELNIQTQLRNDLQKDHIAADSPEALALEKFIRDTDTYTQSLKAVQAQIEANVQITKTYETAVQAVNTKFLDTTATMLEGGVVKWADFWKQIEDIAIKALLKIVQQEIEANIIGNLTQGTINAGAAVSGIGSSGTSALASAATQLLSAASAHQAAAAAIQTSAVSLQQSSALIGQSSQQAAISQQQTDAQSAGVLDQASQVAATVLEQAGFSLEQAAVILAQSGAMGGSYGGIVNAITGSSGAGAGAAAGMPASYAGEFTGASTIDLTGAAAGSSEAWAGASTAGSTFGSAAGGAMMGVLYGGAIAFAGWVVSNVITGFSNNAEGKGTVFDQNSGGMFGSDPLRGATAGTVIAYDQAGQQIAAGLQAFFVQFEKATGQILTALPGIGVRISEDGKNFQALVNGLVVGTFGDLGAATTVAIETGLSQSNLKNLPQIVQDYIKSLTSPDASGTTVFNTNANQMLANVTTLEQIIQGANGAISQITTNMQKYVDTATGYVSAIVSMGLSTANLTTALKDVNSGIIANDVAERNSIIGIQLTAKQKQELDRQTYNAALALQSAQVQQQIIQLQVEALGIAGNTAYINSVGQVGRAVVAGAEIMGKAAAVIDTTNQVLLDSINAAIKSDQALLAQFQSLVINPSDLRAPGGSSSASSALTSAAQALETALNNLAMFGMKGYQLALAQLSFAHEAAVEQAHGNKKAIEELNQAYAAQIQLLNEQTRLSIWTAITPLIQQAHGLSSFMVGLAALDAQYAQYTKDAIAAGASTQLLAAIITAQHQAEYNLIMQTVGALSLPLDTAKSNADKFALAVQALNQGLADGVVTSAQWASEMAQIAQKGTSDILTMIEGIYTSVGDTKDAEKVKEELQQINFEIQLAQLQVMASALLATGVITQALYDRVKKIEDYYADPAHQPDWAKINAGATSAASSVNNAASAAASALQTLIAAFTTAKDNIMKLYDSLTSGALGGVAPDKAIAAARAQYDAAMKLAETGDLKGLQDAPAATQSWITAFKSFSPALYDVEIPNIEAELLRLGKSTFVRDAATGVTYGEQLQQTANSTLTGIGTTLSGTQAVLSSGLTSLSTSSQVQQGLQVQMVGQQGQIVGLLKTISDKLAIPVGTPISKRTVIDFRRAA